MQAALPWYVSTPTHINSDEFFLSVTWWRCGLAAFCATVGGNVAGPRPGAILHYYRDSNVTRRKPPQVPNLCSAPVDVLYAWRVLTVSNPTCHIPHACFTNAQSVGLLRDQAAVNNFKPHDIPPLCYRPHLLERQVAPSSWPCCAQKMPSMQRHMCSGHVVSCHCHSHHAGAVHATRNHIVIIDAVHVHTPLWPWP